MTNKEKKERIQKEDGKAFETFNIERDVTYLNPKYTKKRKGRILIRIFRIVPAAMASVQVSISLRIISLA